MSRERHTLIIVAQAVERCAAGRELAGVGAAHLKVLPAVMDSYR